MAPSINYNFEWNPNKALENRKKHGIVFEEAVTVFHDPLAASICDEDHSEDEERWITLGRISSGQTLAVIHTFHELSAQEIMIRIISARKASNYERRQYEETGR